MSGKEKNEIDSLLLEIIFSLFGFFSFQRSKQRQLLFSVLNSSFFRLSTRFEKKDLENVFGGELEIPSKKVENEIRRKLCYI